MSGRLIASEVLPRAPHTVTVALWACMGTMGQRVEDGVWHVGDTVVAYVQGEDHESFVLTAAGTPYGVVSVAAEGEGARVRVAGVKEMGDVWAALRRGLGVALGEVL